MSKINYAKKYSTLNLRLCENMHLNKYNITSLSKESGVAIGTIQKLMTDPHCNPTLSSLEAICNVLNISVSELIGENKNNRNQNQIIIPLVSWETLTEMNAKKIPEQIKSEATVTTSRKVSNETFAVKMNGNSMLPLFPDGTLLILDKQKTYYDTCYILAKLETHNIFVFKQLLIDEPYKYIKAINPAFKENITKLEAKDKIIATLVEAQIQYK